jgi:hypothetical protein
LVKFRRRFPVDWLRYDSDAVKYAIGFASWAQAIVRDWPTECRPQIQVQNLLDQETTSMNLQNDSAPPPQKPGNNRTSDISVSKLIGTIYEAAPTAERCRIIEYLMKPLGVLSLVGVCNGVFAKIWFRNGWHQFRVRPDDVHSISVSDVITLVDYVQQASGETINGLASLIAASPVLACSAATLMMVTLLNRRKDTGTSESRDGGNPPTYR